MYVCVCVYINFYINFFFNLERNSTPKGDVALARIGEGTFN